MMTCFLLTRFWIYHPALFYGLAFLFGIYCHFEGPWLLLIPSLSLWLPCLITLLQRERDIFKPFILSLFLFLTAWCYAHAYYSFPSLPEQGMRGIAHIKIHSLSFQHTLFGERWLYRCELQQFFPDKHARSITSYLPCSLTLTGEQVRKRPRPLANQDYWIPTKLIQTSQGAYVLKVSTHAPWIAIPGSWSLAEQRYQWKKVVTEWIEHNLPHPLSASFLSGLATGEFDDPWMREQFARFGVQHLLAISGFHFAIIASLFNLILSLFLPHRPRLLILLVGLGLYAFFIGAQASVLRAWIMCSFALTGELIHKQTTALNSLGLALLGILCYDPILCQGLGFKLSFGTTAAILLFYQPALEGFQQLFPKRCLSHVIEMDHWNQHGYCLLAFLRQGLALTVAVNVFAMPLTLYYFHHFPWMSLLYNLFFPFLAAGSMCLLFLGGCLSFIPFVAQGIHTFNSFYTDFLLGMTYQVPTEMDTSLTWETLDPLWVVLYFSLVSLGGIVWKEHTKLEEQGSFSLI